MRFSRNCSPRIQPHNQNKLNIHTNNKVLQSSRGIMSSGKAFPAAISLCHAQGDQDCPLIPSILGFADRGQHCPVTCPALAWICLQAQDPITNLPINLPVTGLTRQRLAQHSWDGIWAPGAPWAFPQTCFVWNLPLVLIYFIIFYFILAFFFFLIS